MRISITLAAVAASLIVAGCGGGSPLAPVSPTVPQAARHVKPDVQKLLYISDDATSDVYVYDYPSGAAVRTLTGFYNPQGECVDTNGHIFVTSAGDKEVYEYNYGGGGPIVVLRDKAGMTSYTPMSCAVNPVNGDLAVANVTANAPGSISIFVPGATTPTVHSDVGMTSFSFLGYRPSGALLADGYNSPGNVFQLVKYAGGGFTNVGLAPGGVALVTPGNVQWDGTSLAVGDQSINGIYRFTMAAGNTIATNVAGSPSYFPTACAGSDIKQFFINPAGTKVVGPDPVCGLADSYLYPALTLSTPSIVGPTIPFGSAILAP